ncbi:GcrA family cell cycle regulator [Rhizobium mesoamericanum]|uniref:GcrA cell cycle regulator (Modular protein) n=1 Tax=Rhizobium mesoamericanum STM3625 TaxID=1211777 RepID=K0PKY2_9HYPH|nr:GcrA family cell cycle regulator [Rhizobium mesoamericanum]CCM77111.1 GcrA cell cycle regulator (modular protein) [Rhizobium mesoamericanum STM3625]
MNMRPDIDIEKAAQMWNDGFTSSELSAEFGVKRDVIMGVIARNRPLFKPKRSDVDMEHAAKLWAQGWTMATIATRVGCSETKMRATTRKHRDLFPRRERASVLRERNWTAEDLERASKLWASGASAKDIGREFSVSKNGVLAIAFRHRDLFPLRNKAGHKAVRNSKPMASIMPVRRAVIVPDFGPEEPQIPATEYDLMRLPHAKTLVDLDPCECKWPLTAGGPFLFCAEVTEKRGPYCANHLERSLPARENRRVAA